MTPGSRDPVPARIIPAGMSRKPSGQDGTGRDGTGRDGTGRDGTGRDGTIHKSRNYDLLGVANLRNMNMNMDSRSRSFF